MPTQAQIQQQFDAKAKAGVSPCLWIPPEWETVKNNNGKLVDNSDDAGTFNNVPAAKDRVAKGKNVPAPESPESSADKPNWPHPFADTKHVDETEFKQEDYELVVACLKDKKEALGRLKKIVGPESPGMQRLARVFEWALFRTTELMGDINAALQNEQKYKRARENYLNFLKDLDDHEPEAHSRKLDVKDKESPSGYGRAVKWTCIDPVIFKGQIYGARVVIKWNPHSSSNGIPIEHS
jgi:hypothetical protein